jgi:hypothetical protein
VGPVDTPARDQGVGQSIEEHGGICREREVMAARSYLLSLLTERDECKTLRVRPERTAGVS